MSLPSPIDEARAAQLRALVDRLEVEINDLELLERALTHRSYAFEEGGLRTNERLEFLGDSVLALVVTDEIFHAHASEAEGRLAKLRAAAVKTGSLAIVARTIDLGNIVRLGKGEAASGGSDKNSILADTLEAVIGAIYLDQGYPVAADVVLRLFADRLEDLSERQASLDYKTSLQELTAAAFGALPQYVLAHTGPDHAREFTAQVNVAGVERGHGVGKNKKQAEQAAAKDAYVSLTHDGETPLLSDSGLADVVAEGVSPAVR